MIRNVAGGYLYAIRTVKKYPPGYGDTTQVALQELRNIFLDYLAVMVLFVFIGHYLGRLDRK